VHLLESERRFLNAADGWLDLDEPMEALNELDYIAGENRGHPLVLIARCRVFLEIHKPERTHRIANLLTTYFPELPDGWFYLACACSRLAKHEKAWSALKKCFLQAAHSSTEGEWQKRALDNKDLDAFWMHNQVSIYNR